MAKSIMAAGIVLAGLLSCAPVAGAAQVTQPAPSPVPVVAPSGPSVHMFDCAGTTGVRGCGGGFFWRDGWRGYGCYPC